MLSKGSAGTSSAACVVSIDMNSNGTVFAFSDGKLKHVISAGTTFNELLAHVTLHNLKLFISI